MAPPEEAWDFPAPPLRTPRGEVHVWRASLDPPARHLEDLLRVLSDAERSRAAQFCFDRDRRWFIAGRGVVRRILGSYLTILPDRLQFHAGGTGRPTLSASQGGGMEFSVSHSGGLVLCAVTCDRRIGVDVERTRILSSTADMAGRVLSPREHAVFQALAREQRQAALFRGWTRKEAYLKACGEGLSRSPDRVDVSLPPFEPARRLSVDGEPGASSRWWLRDLAPAPGYVAALAHEGDQVLPMICLQWPEWF
ncbi:4'-phosphopantetheinyl transferase family protein [Geodermatophilus sp. SYSU D01176]